VFVLVYLLFACLFICSLLHACVCMFVHLRTKNRNTVLKYREVVREVGAFNREVCTNVSVSFITSVELSVCNNSKAAGWISMQVFVPPRCDAATPEDVAPHLKSRKTSTASLRKPESSIYIKFGIGDLY
jgi:hypothetical protein